MPDSTKKPIFIIGPARSGTTVIAQALRVGAHIPGYHEGHFLPLLQGLLGQIDKYFHTKRRLIENDLHMIAHVNNDRFKRAIIEEFKQTCEELCPQEVWLDKSPDSAMIGCIDYLRIAWPNARFVFAKRRAIDNVSSRLRKFPHVDFESHCLIWAKTMKSWLDVRDSLRGHYIEIEQREIALNPFEVATNLASFLGLEETEANGINNVFTNKRPQSTGDVETQKAIDITETGWTRDQIRIFHETCDEICTQIGYSHSSAYYL